MPLLYPSEPTAARQLDLPLDVMVRCSPDIRVTRMPDGEVRLRARNVIEAEGSTQQAAAIIGLSERAVRMMIEDGRLRARRPGKRKYLVDLLHARELKETSRL